MSMGKWVPMKENFMIIESSFREADAHSVWRRRVFR
jgi:hypothetical protein